MTSSIDRVKSYGIGIVLLKQRHRISIQDNKPPLADNTRLMNLCQAMQNRVIVYTLFPFLSLLSFPEGSIFLTGDDSCNGMPVMMATEDLKVVILG